MVQSFNIDRSSGMAGVLSQVMSLLEAGAPVDEILELVDKIHEDTVAEQVAHDAKNEADQAQCEADIAQRKDEISEIEATIANLHDYIANKEQEIEAEEAAIAQSHTDIANTRDALAHNAATEEAAHQRRADEIDLYNSQTEDHTLAIEVVDELIAKIEDSTLVGEAPASLSQLASKMKNSKTAKIVGVTASLVESLAFSPADVSKLLNLLRRLGEEFRQSQIEYDAQDASDEAAYRKELEHLSHERDNLNSELKFFEEQLETQEADLETYELELKNANRNLESNEKLLATTQNILANIIADCEELARIYASETARRTEELELLAELREIVVTRLSTMKDYLKEAVEDVTVE